MDNKDAVLTGTLAIYFNDQLSDIRSDVSALQSSTGSSSLFNGTPSPIGTAAAGTSGLAAKGDHVHAHGNQLGGALHANAVASGAAGFLTGADKAILDGLPASLPDPSNANPLPIGVVNPGVGADYSRDDHIHAHGNQSGGALHANAVASGAAGFLTGTDMQAITLPVDLMLRLDYDAAQQMNVGGSIRFRANVDPSFVPRDYIVGPSTPVAANGYYGDNVYLNAGTGGTGNAGDPGGNGGEAGVNGADGGAGTATAVGGDGGNATLFAGDGGATGGAGAGAPGDVLIGAGALGASKGKIGIGNLSFSAASGNADEIWLGNTTDNTDLLVPMGRFHLGDSPTADPSIRTVTGTPEGATQAAIGSLALRDNGAAGTSIYVKESGAGNTGWVPIKTSDVNVRTTSGALAALGIATVYLTSPGLNGSATEIFLGIATRATTVKNLYGFLGTAPGGADTVVVTVRKNGIDQTLTLTMTGAGVTGNDTVNSFTMVAGDRLSVKAVSSGVLAAGLTVSFEEIT